MARIVCFGEILIRLSPPGRELLLQTPELRTNIGGAEANVAVSLSRFGHDTRMASFLPDNALADAAIEELHRHGVDTRFIERAPGRMGLYFATPGAGQRAGDVLYDRVNSAFASVGAQTLDWKTALDGADWLHVSGVTPAVSAAQGEQALRAMKMARERGVKVSFDANFRAKLWETRSENPRDMLAPLFAEADLLFADTRDIALITGENPADSEAAAILAFQRFPNAQLIAATSRKVVSADHHELSAHAFIRNGATRTRTHAITGIVDRIGGGDAFAAGYLHGLIQGWTEQDALDFAAGAAVLKHAIPGDFNLASEADVRFYLSESGSDVRR